MNKTRKPDKFNVGLVLSGGAARGVAHIGALKALNEEGIYPDIISGVSAGAITGALYADGMKPDEMIRLFVEKKLLSFISFTFPSEGFMKVIGIRKLLNQNLNSKLIEELSLPMYICLTNFQNGKAEYINQGDLVETIIASSSIPVLFPPCTINGKIYVDGGVVDNMPINPLKNQCKTIIGVHVNPIQQIEKLDGLKSIAIRTFHMTISAQVINEKKEEFNLFIEPPGLQNYGVMEISKGYEMYDIGYRYTKQMLKEHTFSVY